MYSSTTTATTTKELFISLFMRLESLTLDKSNLYFVELETSTIALLQM